MCFRRPGKASVPSLGGELGVSGNGSIAGTDLKYAFQNQLTLQLYANTAPTKLQKHRFSLTAQELTGTLLSEQLIEITVVKQL
jgi:hypothetical protein